MDFFYERLKCTKVKVIKIVEKMLLKGDDREEILWRSYGRQSDSLVIGGSMLPAKKLISKYRLNRFLQSENQINRICSGKKQFRMQIFV